MPLLVVLGPTASGKTTLATGLAEQLGGEILSCDSVAVYRGLDIGSAKPTAAERSRVPHHGLDLYSPQEACTAGDYARHARAALSGITARGRLPIVAGGTGLYLRALLDGLAPAPLRNPVLRERLRERAMERPPGWLHAVLRRLDPQAAASMHPNDTPKLIRAIEVTLTTRRPLREQWQSEHTGLTGYRVLKLGLRPNRQLLRQRIDARAAEMFARGMVEETRALQEQYGEAAGALRALGYDQAAAVLRGELTLPAATAAAQAGHRQYAKRQMTWFRRDPDIHWLDGFGDQPDIMEAALGAARPHLLAAAPGSAVSAAQGAPDAGAAAQ